ncbi:MAG: hypothetical protein GEV08_25845, partial [Acidimicrobiia bacterium]|nr:hypothetical protein [Acidimicrobiia bacterium]
MDRRLWRAPLVVVLVGLMMTAGMWQWVATSASTRSQARVEDELDQAAGWVGAVLSVLRRELDEAERATRDEPLLAQEDFAARLGPLVDSGAVPGLGAVFFVRPVPAADLAALVEVERAAGLYGFERITPAAGEGAERWLALRQATARSPSSAASVVVALEARVWDLHASGGAREALARARGDEELMVAGVVPASTFGLEGPASGGAGEEHGAPGGGLPRELWLLARWSQAGGGWVVGVLDPGAVLARLPGPIGGA